MKRLTCLLAGLATATTLSAVEHVASISSKADPARGQQIASTICASCHNLDGNSTISANPKLAGQHPEYLLKQMKNFKMAGETPPERVNAIMNGMIAAYDESQMRDLAAHFSEQKLKPDQAKNRDTIEFGQRLYRAGDASKGLPACAGCHGPAGAGIPGQYPRIAGQFAEYTDAQLRKFRDGAQTTAPTETARTNDPNKMMRMVSVKMTDSEIRAVADYIAGLR